MRISISLLRGERGHRGWERPKSRQSSGALAGGCRILPRETAAAGPHRTARRPASGRVRPLDPALGDGEGTVWALTLGWGPWAIWRPEMTGSQSLTSQTRMDVAEELRTKWGLPGAAQSAPGPKGEGAGGEGTGWFPCEIVPLVWSGDWKHWEVRHLAH